MSTGESCLLLMVDVVVVVGVIAIVIGTLGLTVYAAYIISVE